MRMSRYHVVALVSNLGLGAIAMADTVAKGLTGGSITPEESFPTGLALAWLLFANLVHGVAYAALIVVLVKERARFALTNRFARVMRIALIIMCVPLAVGFLLDPVWQLLRLPWDSGILLQLSNWVVTPAFLGTFLCSAALGLALLRNNPLGIGGRVLLGVLPAIAVMIALAFLATDWAHPGIVEVFTGVGVALLGVLPSRARAVDPAEEMSALSVA